MTVFEKALMDVKHYACVVQGETGRFTSDCGQSGLLRQQQCTSMQLKKSLRYAATSKLQRNSSYQGFHHGAGKIRCLQTSL